MNTQLFDRIINVTLWRKYSESGPYSAVRLVRAEQAGQNYIRLDNPVFSSINLYIYKGLYTREKRESSITQRNGSYLSNNGRIKIVYSGKYKYTYALGPIYRFSTFADIMNGYRPDGLPFQPGDKLYTMDTKEYFYVGENISIDYTTYKRQELSQGLSIRCKDTGRKPDITLSVKLLPGQLCYNVTVEIKNLFLPLIDIKSFTHMVIEAGYGKSTLKSYKCSIFTSYMKTPGPDGVTVFTGIEVGEVTDLIRQTHVKFIFKGGNTTVGKLIEQVAQGITFGTSKVENSLSEEYNSQPINVALLQEFTASSGYACMEWLKRTLEELYFFRSQNPPVKFLLNFTDNTLFIAPLDGTGKSPSLPSTHVTDLRMINSASFSGTALTVEAPWNPDLLPLGYFTMPPQFINGANLPNSISEEDYTNKGNIYRVVTMQVDFSTVQNTNRMTILAIPYQYLSEEETTRYSGVEEINDWARKLTEEKMKSRIKEEEFEDLRIEIGDGNTEETSLSNSTVEGKKESSDMFEVLVTMPVSNVKIDTLTIGAAITQYVYNQYVANGPFTRGQVASSLSEAKQYLRIELPENVLSQNEWLRNNKTACKITSIWPVITVATHASSSLFTIEGITFNKMDKEQLDFLRNGCYLAMPVLNTYADLVSVKDIFKWAYLTYGKQYTTYADDWYRFYYFLGGRNLERQ